MSERRRVNERARARVRIRRCGLVAFVAVGLAACGSGGGDTSPEAIGTPAPTPRVETTPAPSAAPEPTARPDPDLPPRLRLTTVAEGLDRPLYVVSPPGDDRLFALEQTGRVRLLDDAGLRRDSFLDLSSLVGCCGERGLLGIAFHPDYAANGRFFVDYTDRGGDTVIAEYARSDGDHDRADPEEVRRLLHVDQPFVNHNGGMLEFGPDGLLYAGFGDGGGGGDPFGNGQDPTSKLGAILRIDVDTHPLPPEGNWPGADPDVWAIGLRNPWRFSFDRETGDLYVGDVGQNRWEEVDIAPAGAGGANYGWNVMEGAHCFEPAEGCDSAASVAPAVEYGRDLGCSVTGGYVYRGRAIPGLVGWYVYGDYCSNRIWALRWEDGAVRAHVELTDDLDSGRWLDGLSSFGQDAAGEIYAVSLGGAVFRIDPE